LRSLVLLLSLAVWLTDAQAFFCFSFGGHARHRDYPLPAPWQPPPPMAYTTPAWNLPQAPESESLPPIRETKKSPDIIQGYRFRPLAGGQPALTPSPPADWRD